MQRIAVINPKGGSGKTILATNLASFFCQQGKLTTLMDLDPQGSSVFWMLNRPDSAPHIQLVDAHNCPHNVTRSWAIQPPRNTEVLILDTPARPDLTNLSPLLREATAILIPTLLAGFDRNALVNTIQELRRMLPSQRNMALVINRSSTTSQDIQQSGKLGKELKLPVIATLRDSQTFLETATSGLGVYEQQGDQYQADKQEIEKIAEWCTKAATRLNEEPGKRLNPDVIAMASLA